MVRVMVRVIVRAAVIVLACACVVGAGAGNRQLVAAHAAPEARAPATTGPCGTTAAAPTYKHVIWIWMENNSYGQIEGSSSAPYTNSLGAACGIASNYTNITHDSLPNYLGATDGAPLSSLLTFDGDCLPSSTCEVTTTNLFKQAGALPGGYKAYDESMPAPCTNGDSGTYITHHNPALYYTDLAKTCPTRDVALGTTTSSALLTDFAKAKTAPAFSFLTPNGCDDMHGVFPTCLFNLVQMGDTWLSTWIPLITATPVYESGDTAIFITWDEGSGGTVGEACAGNTTDQSCHVLTVVVAPSVVPGTNVSTLFTHYSLLKTTEDMLGLKELGLAKTATSMAAGFNL
jgi:phosphatidylinositol-3-phosphatase